MRSLGRLVVGFAMVSAMLRAASASPLEDPTVGTSTFTGVSEPHATAILISPAALSMTGSGIHMFAQLGTRLSMLFVDRELIDPDTREPIAGPSVSENIIIPGGLLALYGQFADRGSAGIAISLPMIERFASSEEFAYHSGGGSFMQAQVSVAGTLRLGDRFHLGLGVSLAYSRFAFKLARDTAMDAGTAGILSDCGGAPCGLENPLARQDIEITAATQGVSGFFNIPDNIGAVLGAIYEIRPDWWRLALSVVAPPGTFTDLPLRGDAVVTDAPRDGGTVRRGTAEVPFRIPESIRFGVRGPVTEDLDLHASVHWQNTSRHRLFDIRMFGAELEAGDVPEFYPRFRGLRDSVRVQVGLERRSGYELRYGGRIGVDSGAVKGSRLTPIQVEGWSVHGSGGVERRVAERFVLSATYNLSVYPPRTTSPSAFDPRSALDCVDSGFNEASCGPSREGRATPSAAGTYTRLEHGLVFSLRYDSL